MAWFRGNRLLRSVDRYAGIPIVAGLALARRWGRGRGRWLGRGPEQEQEQEQEHWQRWLPERPARIGLMKSVSLGDLVLMTGVVRDVRARFPDATLIGIGGDDNRQLWQMMLGDGDEQVVVSPARLAASVRAMRAAKMDLLLDFGAWVRFDAVLSALSGAPFTVGFDTAGQRRHLAYDIAVPYSGAIHELENNRNIARAIGIDAATPPTIDGGAPLGEKAAALRSPYVVLHAWGGGYKAWAREWATERWAALARELHGRGRQVVLTGGPSDVERSRELASALRSAGAEVWDAAGSLSIPETVTLLRGSEAVVSVNTGVMHLAAAAGARTVGLHGPTSVVRFGPVGPRVEAVVTRTPGCGYLNLGWEYRGRRTDCMDGVELGDVLAALDRLLLM